VTATTDSASSPHTDPLESGPAPAHTADPGEGRTLPGGLRRWWPPALCCALYVVLTMIYFGHLGSMGPNVMTGPRGIDQISQIWWIAWVQSALAHGHNPFFTTWQNYPVGQNAGWNCSMLALGVLISPITTAFGPVVAWDILLKLAIVLSATSMCLVLRRWTTWWPAAFIGGLLYGFSVYETALGGTYLFLSFVPLPPLFLLLLHEALVRQRWKPARVGVLLGLVAGVQFLVSAEVFASTVLIGGIAVALYLLFNWKSAATGLLYIKRTALYGILVGGLLLVIPAGYTLIGPEHIDGAVNSPTYLETLHADLLGPIIPTNGQRLTTPTLSHFALHLNYTALMYLGLPLVILAIAIIWWMRHRGMVLFLAAMAAISFLLSLGPHLWVRGHNTGVLLPMALLNQLPLAAGFIAARFALFTVLFIAALVAIGLEELYHRLALSRALNKMSIRGRAIVATGLVLSVALIVAIPTLPAHAQQVSRTDASSFFTSEDAQSNIRPGSVVLAYPYPGVPLPAANTEFGFFYPYQIVNDALFDQAISGIPFKLVGGYGWRPHSGPYGFDTPSTLRPPSVEAFFDVEFYGFAKPLQARLSSGADITADLQTFSHNYHVDTVVVLPIGKHPEVVIRALTAALGSPSRSHGVTVWYHVQRRLASLVH
jgi:hypothetical protein